MTVRVRQQMTHFYRTLSCSLHHTPTPRPTLLFSSRNTRISPTRNTHMPLFLFSLSRTYATRPPPSPHPFPDSETKERPNDRIYVGRFIQLHINKTENNTNKKHNKDDNSGSKNQSNNKNEDNSERNEINSTSKENRRRRQRQEEQEK